MLDNKIGATTTTTDASPASSESISPASDAGSPAATGAPRSAREWLSERAASRAKAGSKAGSESTPAVPDIEVASDVEDGSGDKDGSQPSKKEKENTDTVHPKFQKRIDRLTAKYHETQRAVAERDIQIAKLQKAAEILQAELGRVTAKAQLDPKEEQLAAMRYEREVEKFTSGLDKQKDELYNAGISEYTVQARADEILDEVNELVVQYDLVSPEEILLAMRDRGLTAAVAARQLHTARLEKAAKRTAVAHPATTARAGAPATNAVDTGYRGADSIRDFLNAKIAARTGRSK
jgi:hypothetical protein